MRKTLVIIGVLVAIGLVVTAYTDKIPCGFEIGRWQLVHNPALNLCIDMPGPGDDCSVGRINYVPANRFFYFPVGANPYGRVVFECGVPDSELRPFNHAKAE